MGCRRSRLLGFRALLVLVAALAGSAAGRAQETDVQIVAVDGMSIGSTPYLYFFKSALGAPVVDRDGIVAFGHGVGSGYSFLDHGLFIHGLGEMLPGFEATTMLVGPGAVISDPETGFEPAYDRPWQHATLALSGSAVYVFAREGTQEGIWKIAPEISGDGDPASAVAPIAVGGGDSPAGRPWQRIGFRSNDGFDEIYRVNPRDSVLFFASDGETEGLFLHTVSEGTTPVASHYDPVPGDPSQEIAEIGEFFLTDSDVVIFEARTSSGEASRGGLWSWQGGVATLVAAPRMSSSTPGECTVMNPPYVGSPKGHVAFHGYRYEEDESGTSRSVYSVFLLDPSGATTLVYDVEQPFSGLTVAALGEVAVSEDGDVAIIENYREGDVSGAVLAITSSPSTVAQVAATEALAPEGGVFRGFGDLAFNSHGELAFTAVVSDGSTESIGVYLYRDGGVEAVLPAGADLTGPDGAPLTTESADFYGYTQYGSVFGDEVICFVVELTDEESPAIACAGLPWVEPAGRLDLLAEVEAQPGPSEERATAEEQPPDFIYTAYLESPSDDALTWQLTATFSGPVMPVEITPTVLGAEKVEGLCGFETDETGHATEFVCDQPDESGLRLPMGVSQPVQLGVAVGQEAYASDELAVRFEASGATAAGLALEAAPVTLESVAYVADLAVSITGTDPLTLQASNHGPRTVSQVQVRFNREAFGFGDRVTLGYDDAGVFVYTFDEVVAGESQFFTFEFSQEHDDGILEALIGGVHGEHVGLDPDLSNNWLRVDSTGEPPDDDAAPGCKGDGCSQGGSGAGDRHVPTSVVLGALALWALVWRRGRTGRGLSSAAASTAARAPRS